MRDDVAGPDGSALSEGLGPRCRSETGDVMLCADAACGWMGRCLVAEPLRAGDEDPRGCPTPGACSAAAEIAGLRVQLHHMDCAAQAAEEDRDDLLALLSALVDRCAFDGVPNDSLPTWQAAHDAVMSRKRA